MQEKIAAIIRAFLEEQGYSSYVSEELVQELATRIAAVVQEK